MIDATMLRPALRRTSPNDGMAAIPDSWIPSGAHRAQVDTSYGSDRATISRNPSRVTVDCDSHWSPDVRIDALDERRVKVVLDMPFPFPNIEARGPLHRDGAVAHLEDELSDRTADMWHLSDGRTVIQVHEPQKEDVNVILTFD